MPHKNKNEDLAYKRKRWQHMGNVLSRYKRRRGCDNCGYNKQSAVLEFHHLHDKKKQISDMWLHGKTSIKEEITKCELLCANCHREKRLMAR